MWMTILLYSLASIQGIVIFVWFWQQVEMNRIRDEGLHVPIRPHFVDLPPLTVIIPARNESARITECLQSVLRQDYPGLQLLVVDDRSTDDTGVRVRRVFADDPRCRVHSISELPDGWGGKSHALWVGTKHTDTPWLLFLDADGRIEPGGLASAVQYAIDRNADMLSLWPRDASEGFWERLLIPLCGAMIVIWYGRRAAHDPATPLAFANGQFLLCRRMAYDAVGGHAAVKDALVEDIPFARRAKAHGLRVMSGIGSDVVKVRMYSSLSELIAGWRRIYVGVLTPMQIVLCAVSILIGSLPPFVVPPILLVRSPRTWESWPSVFLVLSGVHLGALIATSVRFFSIAHCRLRYLWLYPLSCLGVLGILASAFRCAVGKADIEWRGTAYGVQRSRIQNQGERETH